MSFILLITTMIIIAIIFVYSLRNKIHKLTLVNFILISVFYIGIMIIYFYIITFNMDITMLIFPDEFRYAYGTYNNGFFDKYVQFLISIGGFSFARAINLLMYMISITLLFDETVKIMQSTSSLSSLKNRISIILLFSLSSMGAYWSFFLLKESLTTVALSFILLGHLMSKKIYKLFGAFILIITRTHYYIAYLIFIGMKKIYNKSKKQFKLVIIIVIIIAGVFLNSSYFLQTMSTFVSRRYLDTDTTPIETRQELKTEIRDVYYEVGSVKFLISKIYFETIINNINRTYNPTIHGSLWVKILVLLNLVSVLWVFLKLRPPKNMFYYYFIFTLTYLILTHSNMRYVNAIITPFTMYFIVCDQLSRRRTYYEKEILY